MRLLAPRRRLSRDLWIRCTRGTVPSSELRERVDTQHSVERLTRYTPYLVVEWGSPSCRCTLTPTKAEAPQQRGFPEPAATPPTYWQRYAQANGYARALVAESEQELPKQHVVTHNGRWALRPEGGSRVSATFDTQAQAIQAGRVVASNQNTELVIHRPNGQIRDAESYGNDPCPPRDKS